jgi:hypothetical protein
MEARRQQEMDEVECEPVRRGWCLGSEAELVERRKSDPAKLALAARLRRETTLTVGWIAQRLHLGTRKSAAVKLHRWGNTKQKVEPDQVKTMV